MKKGSYLLAVFLLLSLSVLSACGETTPTAITSGVDATTASAPTTTSVPNKLNDDLIGGFVLATQSGDYQKIYDATPDLSGSTIYFTSSNSKGSGVFKAPAAGGAATEVLVGSPFVAARALAFSPDGQTLFVADPAAQSNGKTGAIFRLPLTGDKPQILDGSEGTAPQNLDIVGLSGQSSIYFSGKDPFSGQAALLKLGVAGGQTPGVVVKGAPLVEPDGVAVNQAGIAFVSDHSGKVFKVENGQASELVSKMVAGNPAGIALSPDEAVLMISSQKAGEAAAQVLLVNTKTHQTGLVTKGVSQNPVAGGLHPSPDRKRGIYAWAGVIGGGNGGIGRSYYVSMCRSCADQVASSIACCK